MEKSLCLRSLLLASLKRKPSESILLLISLPFLETSMDQQRRRRQHNTTTSDSEEVSSIEWEFINMSEEEEDLIHRMYKLVGDRWSLIAGRIPGRKAEEIERFWIMKHAQMFATRRENIGTYK